MTTKTFYAAMSTRELDALNGEAAPQPVVNRAKKTSTLGIFLIALAVLVAGATVLMCIKFHAYRPFSQNYHYLGLTVIALGGTVLTGFIVYKGIISIKQSKTTEEEVPQAALPKFTKQEQEFLDIINNPGNKTPVQAFLSALKLYPDHIINGSVTLKTFAQGNGEFLRQVRKNLDDHAKFDLDDANILAKNLGNLWNTYIKIEADPNSDLVYLEIGVSMF